MEYKELNDNELVYLCNENNEDAVNLIIEKYKKYILIILKDLLKEYNIVGYEISDFYQEGLIGLLQAINSYKEEKNISFYTYACKCIKNNIMSAIRISFRLKNRILNNSYSLDKLLDESNEDYYNCFKDNSSDPDNILMKNEEKEELIGTLKNKLSKSENIVFDLRLKGLKNSEICELLGKSRKSIENTMNRINIKYKSIFEK